jgi:hypothetical protein
MTRLKYIMSGYGISRSKAKKVIGYSRWFIKHSRRHKQSEYDAKGGRIYYINQYGVDVSWQWIFENGLHALKKLIESGKRRPE